MKIKILYIIDQMKEAGAQKHLADVIRGLSRDDFEPRLITLKDLGVKRIYGLSGIIGIFKLIVLIKREKFDIVQTYLFSENILGVIAARLGGAKVIITGRRDTGMLLEGKWQHILAYWLTNPFVDKIVCVSEAVRQVVLTREHVASEKVEVIYNGVDINKFRTKCMSALVHKCIRSDDYVVGMIANFSWIKGHRDFIEAARMVLKEVPNTTFLLAGEGPLLKGYKAITSQSHTLQDRILFLGKRSDVPEILSMVEVSVNASYSEGMSNTILESMAAGVPVVATAVDGNKETVIDGVTGILVPPKNPKAMADAIIKLLKDRALAEKMGENGRERVENKFTSDIMINNMEELYKDLLRPKIAFLMSQFPETHETFILRELCALEEKGVGFEILSLKCCKDRVIHPQAKELMNRTVYGRVHRVVGSIGSGSLLHPIRIVSSFGYVLRTYWINPKELAKALYVWLECLYFARIIKERRITHIHSHWATLPTTAALILSKLTGVSFSFTAHAWDIFVSQDGLAEKIRQAKFVVTCTDYNREYLESSVSGFAGSRVNAFNAQTPKRAKHAIYLNYHGLEKEWFALDRKPKTENRKPIRILAIGRLVEQKGFEYLIEACRILRDRGVEFECNIVGEGPLGEKLKLLVVSCRLLDKVKMLGLKTQEEIKELYMKSDIFVAPSVIAKNGDRDGIPNVLLEAMAMGIPAVGTNVSGIPEVVIDKVTGILVKERESIALADAIERLLKDHDLRTRLSMGGRELVKSHFDSENNVDELIGIFRQNGILSHQDSENEPKTVNFTPIINDALSVKIGVGT